jgi:hypothetical protein
VQTEKLGKTLMNFKSKSIKIVCHRECRSGAVEFPLNAALQECSRARDVKLVN